MNGYGLINKLAAYRRHSLYCPPYGGEKYSIDGGDGEGWEGGYTFCIRGTPAAQRSGCEDSLVDPVGRPLVRTH